MQPLPESAGEKIYKIPLKIRDLYGILSLAAGIRAFARSCRVPYSPETEHWQSANSVNARRSFVLSENSFFYAFIIAYFIWIVNAFFVNFFPVRNPYKALRKLPKEVFLKGVLDFIKRVVSSPPQAFWKFGVTRRTSRRSAEVRRSRRRRRNIPLRLIL